MAEGLGIIHVNYYSSARHVDIFFCKQITPEQGYIGNDLWEDQAR